MTSALNERRNEEASMMPSLPEERKDSAGNGKGTNAKGEEKEIAMP